MITLIKMRFLPTDEQFSLRGDTLKQAIQEDKARGLVPLMVCEIVKLLPYTGLDNFTQINHFRGLFGDVNDLKAELK